MDSTTILHKATHIGSIEENKKEIGVNIIATRLRVKRSAPKNINSHRFFPCFALK